MGEDTRVIREDVPEKYSDEPLTEDGMPTCSSMMGHELTPFRDESGGPQTRMGCLHCGETRLVMPGDLHRYSHEDYPPWCDVENADSDGEADSDA